MVLIYKNGVLIRNEPNTKARNISNGREHKIISNNHSNGVTTIKSTFRGNNYKLIKS